MKFCTAEEMRRLDHKTIHECGIPGVVLMENAGRGAAVLVRKYMGDLYGRRVAVICGRGNNGGDGFVMGRIFYGWGASVRFFLLGRMDQVQGDARVNLQAALNMGLEVVEVADESRLDRLDLHEFDILVDAILGTGLNSEVRGIYRDVIERVNHSGLPVAAVDIPSGLSADTGQVLGMAVRADLTVTFGLPKIGLLMPPGEQLAGRLEVVDIGIPPHVLAEADPGKELLLEDTLKGLLHPRVIDGHKGLYGHVLVVAGSPGKTGAAALTSLSAARSGAGLVTLAVAESLNPILEAKTTEAMTEPLPEEGAGILGPSALDRIMTLAEGKSVVALGPGLGTAESTRRLMVQLLERCEAPVVIDADGLNCLADDPAVLKSVRREAVITPHPGEMSRLTGLKTAEIAEDRLAAAKEFAAKCGVVCVLKGYRTIVAAPQGDLFLNTTGGPLHGVRRHGRCADRHDRRIDFTGVEPSGIGPPGGVCSWHGCRPDRRGQRRYRHSGVGYRRRVARPVEPFYDIRIARKRGSLNMGLKAKDIMSRQLITVNTGTTVKELAEVLVRHRISGTPVVDDQGKLVGVVSQSDLVALHKIPHLPRSVTLFDWVIYLEDTGRLEHELEKMAGVDVGDIMTSEPETVAPESSLEETATIMSEKGVHTIPVLDGDRLVGVVGKLDIVRSLLG